MNSSHPILPLTHTTSQNAPDTPNLRNPSPKHNQQESFQRPTRSQKSIQLSDPLWKVYYYYPFLGQLVFLRKPKLWKILLKEPVDLLEADFEGLELYR
jgi:hypothetical protein